MSVRTITAAVMVLVFAGCIGERGPEGSEGETGAIGAPGGKGDPGENGAPGVGGTPGEPGATGATGCDGLNADASLGLVPLITASAPGNGQFFAPGEKVTFTLKVTDRCNRGVKAAALGTSSLYFVGPRKGSLAKSANKLLNCIVDRNAADRQHHYINLKAPKFLDTTQANFAESADGVITFTTAPVSSEAPGTYTAGFYVKSLDDKDQFFEFAEVQVGTATKEIYASGEVATSKCFDCHKGPNSGKSYQQHSFPGRSPYGNYAIDSKPMATCHMCHNQDGYSVNTTVRKVHGAHRGEHQMNPGVAHPEYNVPADNTMLEYLNVGFPVIPGGERACDKCHADDRWKTPSRAGCGSCHDNLFFASDAGTGVLNPPRVIGKATVANPDGGVCANSAQCNFATGFTACNTGVGLCEKPACTANSDCGGLLSCNTATGLCERRIHPSQPDDTNCNICHGEGSSIAKSVTQAHLIPGEDLINNLKFDSVSFFATTTGGSTVFAADGGVFNPGDVYGIKFKLSDKNGNRADLLTNSKLTPTLIVSGPTDDRQRIIGSVNLKPASATAGTLTYDSTAKEYTYLATYAEADGGVTQFGLPASSISPFNSGLPARVNPPGTYTAYLYVTEQFNLQGVPSFRDAASSTTDFKFKENSPVRPRDTILSSSCNSCHVDLQLHGGSRQEPEACSTCHTTGSMDRIVGGKGRACTADAQCPGFGESPAWEACVIPSGGTSGTCTITVDPTPNTSIAFGPMIHNIHFARLREGYTERNDVKPELYRVIGYSNSAIDFTEVLFPQDIRNCSKCHTDSNATCSASAVCGVGQACVSGKCKNTAWKDNVRADVCMSCHDSQYAAAHALINTYDDGTQKLESCLVCHAAKSEFSSEKSHSVSDPYIAPYLREKE